MLGVLCSDLTSLEKCRLEDDFKIVVVLDQVGDIDAVREEHVVRAQQCFSIQEYMGKCIQALKRKDDFGTVLIRRGWYLGELNAVVPCLLSDPFDINFVRINERV